MKVWHILLVPAILLSMFGGLSTPNVYMAAQNRELQGSHQSTSALQAGQCVWLCPDQIRSFPAQGEGWDNIVRWADSSVSPDLNGKTNDGDLVALANAIVYVHTGDSSRRDKAIDYIQKSIGTEGGNALPVSRNLPGYLIAANLIEYDGYQSFAREILDKNIGGNGGNSVLEKALNRPNNHGTMALAAWTAIAIYTDDPSGLDRAANVFKGWMGDRSAYNDFKYGSLEWQDEPDNPIGINCKGCPRDGAQPEEMRRGGSAQQYSWEALQGAFLTSEILYLNGYSDVYDWVDQALLRAVKWNHSRGWPAEGDDEWVTWIVNARYGTDYSTRAPARSGKNFGFTDFFYADGHGSIDATPVPTQTPDPNAPTPTPTSPVSGPTATPTDGPISPDINRVTASGETEPVPNNGDAADDPAIWVHPTDRSLSTIIGTDKQGGLAVYDLEGKEIQYLNDGNLNNVDLRYNFLLGGTSVDLVVAGNRTGNIIEIYQVDSASRELSKVAAREIQSNLKETYGLCMYRSSGSGKYYAIVNDKWGQVEQWELFANSNGKVDATLVRTLEVGSTTEGCVADDEMGTLYIGEERVGIWKYGAEPDAGDERQLVDSTDSDGHLSADVEGLTIYYTSGGAGYLLASSQGSNEFVVYQREGNNDYVMTFTVQSGNGIDGAEETDGIDVTNLSLGSAFPQGLFVVQDGINDEGNQNYKLIPWERIANVADPTLTIDTEYRPSTGTISPQPTPTPTEPGPGPTPTPTEEPIPVDPHGARAEIRVDAPSEVAVGSNFNLIVEVLVGDLETDGASAYINFDPSVLNVVSITPGNTFDTPIQSTFDNDRGHVDFAAGSMSGGITGQFTLAEITFQALSESDRTDLILDTQSPRQSDLTWQGESILRQIRSDQLAVVAANNTVTLKGSVELEGRPNSSGSEWVMPLSINVFNGNSASPDVTFNPTTNEHGEFEISGLSQGEYLVAVKGSHTLQRIVPVQLNTNTTSVDFGRLLEGDSVSDNIVNIIDFSRLASGYNLCADAPNYVQNADFDGDGCVGLADFSLLSKNFGQSGDHVDALKLRSEELTQIGMITDKSAGERFSLNIAVNSQKTLLVDGGSLYLSFDPTVLKVVEIVPNGPLNTVLENSANNGLGQINYAAGILGGEIHTPFELATIEFEALQNIEQSNLYARESGIRQSKLAYQGQLVAGQLSYDGDSTIHYSGTPLDSKVYLPLMMR